MTDLETRLARLAEDRVTAVPASQVMARGLQLRRTRRMWRATSTAVALVAVLGGALAVVPRLGEGGGEGEAVVAAATFSPLGPDEGVVQTRRPRVSPDGYQVTVDYSMGGCGTQQGTSWDVAENPFEVRVRLIAKVRKPLPGDFCPAVSFVGTAQSPSFAQPLGERRLVVDTGASELYAQGSIEPFPALPAGARPLRAASFSVNAYQLIARYSAGPCESPLFWEVRESATEVLARVSVRHQDQSCSDDVALATTTTRTLAIPVGTRELLVRNGDEAPVTPRPSP